MKIFKWIFALVAGIGGILAMMLVPAGNKRKKIKALDKKIKAVDKELELKENQQKSFQKTLKSKKKVLEEIKEKQYQKKEVSTKEASDFLKKYAKKKKK
jgi:septal ring factor EnvC (AmiA/AmiB activator)